MGGCWLSGVWGVLSLLFSPSLTLTKPIKDNLGGGHVTEPISTGGWGLPNPIPPPPPKPFFAPLRVFMDIGQTGTGSLFPLLYGITEELSLYGVLPGLEGLILPIMGRGRNIGLNGWRFRAATAQYSSLTLSD